MSSPVFVVPLYPPMDYRYGARHLKKWTLKPIGHYLGRMPSLRTVRMQRDKNGTNIPKSRHPSLSGCNDTEPTEAVIRTFLSKIGKSSKLEAVRRTIMARPYRRHPSSPPNIMASGACTHKRTLTCMVLKKQYVSLYYF